MVLAEWNDGFVLDRDPRREDPLFYYRSGNDWSRAIGLEVSRPQKAVESAPLEIEVFSDHKIRECILSDTERAILYQRCVPRIIQQFRSCSMFTLNAARMESLLCFGSLEAALQDLGFELQSKSDQATSWLRA